jgi:hypothetical protein
VQFVGPTFLPERPLGAACVPLKCARRASSGPRDGRECGKGIRSGGLPLRTNPPQKLYGFDDAVHHVSSVSYWDFKFAIPEIKPYAPRGFYRHAQALDLHSKLSQFIRHSPHDDCTDTLVLGL